MTEKINKINGIDICTETFGDSSNPAVLLIMGAMCSMVYWDDEFCQRIADNGRFVIRYDNRDVGRSVAYEPGKSNYTVVDMAEDAVGVLDGYKIAYHATAATLDWTDEKAVATYLVNGSALLCGSRHKFDEESAFKQVRKEIKRANNLLSMFNHALLQDDHSFDGKINEINVPVLIIHGTEDTILTYEHALALNKEIPNSPLLTLEGSGHEIHSDDWEQIINAILKHSSTLKA